MLRRKEAGSIYDSSPTTINVLGNDVDLDVDDHVRIVGFEPNGLTSTTRGGNVYCTSGPGGSCRYTPRWGGPWPVDDTFTYEATDGFGPATTATVTIHLANRPPDAVDDSATVHGAVPHQIAFLENDSEPDGDAITGLEVDRTGTAGTVDCSLTSGFCTFTPAEGFLGEDVFHYTLTDARGATSDSAAVRITVVENNVPTAAPDFIDLHGNRSATPINVLANDSDLDAEPLFVTPHVFTTAKGSVECDAQGCIYTPFAASTGTDTFYYTITDGYGGTSDPALVTVGIDVVTTTVALGSSPNPSDYQQPVLLTATIVAPGGGTPTGSVAFREGAATLGSGTVSGGIATLSVSTLSPGPHSITATFTGSLLFAGSSATSMAILQVVGQVAPTVALASSVDPSAVGAPVTFTATVSPPAGLTTLPTGTVTFLEGEDVLGTAELVDGAAAYTTSTLAAGLHDIVARYEGDASYDSATSDALTQHVGTPTAVDDPVGIAEDAGATTSRCSTTTWIRMDRLGCR